MSEQERAQVMADRLRRLKGGLQWGNIRVHPLLKLEDRDLIVRALEYYATHITPDRP